MTEARHRYFYPVDVEQFFGPLDQAIASANEPLRLPATAFRSNLVAAAEVVSVPYRMVSESAHRRRFQSIHTAERIRARGHKAGVEDDPAVERERDALGLQRARARFAEELATPAGLGALVGAILSELRDHLDDAAFSAASEDLLRQGAVLVWSAVEVFLSDVYEATRGNHPPGPLDCLSRLIPEIDDPESALTSRGLWLLYQQRHLIVHRRAIVDAAYLAKTHEQNPLGSTLVITPDSLDGALARARDLGIELLS